MLLVSAAKLLRTTLLIFSLLQLALIVLLNVCELPGSHEIDVMPPSFNIGMCCIENSHEPQVLYRNTANLQLALNRFGSSNHVVQF